uniref:Major facilitator superfamily (MFS) profile domain-containing protein n=1 Tax=Micromonas pusilla TaxID=38833 RepID=A0A7S0KI24_MICPS|mmetsp:Transcript_14019/g.55518  ORF Transcript_14019/g.55518 Transcript_14019/m.55518 type:complete len:567 (+) Transcript_14019:91-1791(+)
MRGVGVGVAAPARAPPRCQIGHRRARSAPQPVGGPVPRQVSRGFTIRRPALGGRCERVVSRPASASRSRALVIPARPRRRSVAASSASSQEGRAPSPDPDRDPRSRRRDDDDDDDGFAPGTTAQYVSVACVMLAVFLHLLGFTVTGPITPSLVAHFGLHPAQVGYLTSAYPLGMFFALFAWPRLSDTLGRKPILVASLLGVGVGLVAQAACVTNGWSLATFLGLRVASGAFAGASPVVKAYLADAASPEQLPSFMAWREAACTLAFIVGPTLGGLMFSANEDLGACIAVTGWASVGAAFIVAVAVREIGHGVGLSNARVTLPSESEDESGKPNDAEMDGYTSASNAARQAAREQARTEALSAPACPLGRRLYAAVATICVTSFLYNAGQSTFDSFFPVFCAQRCGMGPTRIGATLTALAAVSFSISAAGFARVNKKLGLTSTTALGLALVAVGLGAIGAAPTAGLTLFAATLYVTGIPLFTPAIPILLMQCVPPNRRGAVMGLDSAVNAVARIATPIALGGVYHASPTVAFAVAGGVVAFACALVLVRRWMVMGPGMKFGGVGSAR